jgi:hypothetical protein
VFQSVSEPDKSAAARVVCESGARWLAFALHRVDFEFEDRFRDLMKLRPSECWRHQSKATLQFDPISAKLIDDIGVETMMWGFDYPRWAFPERPVRCPWNRSVRPGCHRARSISIAVSREVL